MKKIKNKHAQEALGLSFGMMVAILLIIFFIVIAGIVIFSFISNTKCSQVGIFTSEFNQKVDELWALGEGATEESSWTLPGKFKFVCFVDLNKPALGDNINIQIYNNLSRLNNENNLILYPLDKECKLGFKEIKHLGVDSMIDTSKKNPICVPLKNGKITLRLQKEDNEPFVKLTI